MYYYYYCYYYYYFLLFVLLVLLLLLLLLLLALLLLLLLLLLFFIIILLIIISSSSTCSLSFQEEKKSTLVFVFQDYVLYICAPAAFQSHTNFSHALDGKMSSILNLAMEHFVTNTHISCLEPAAVQSCKHIALKQFFLAIYNAMPASFSPTQKYRFPARTHPTIRLK